MNNAANMAKYLEKVRDIWVEIPRLFEKNDRKVEQLDKESSDLLHAIELLGLDEEGKIRIASELEENRLHRRRCKDENLILKSFYDFIKAHPKMLHELRICHNETEKACQLLKDRNYHPRIRMDLTEAFAQAKRMELEEHTAVRLEQLMEESGL